MFIHHAYQPGETIAAIATPLGEGGIAVIRISGKAALTVAEKVFSGPVRSFKSHTAHYGHILDPSGNKIDAVLVLVMLGTRSYTGEDTVEIHCHGGSIITRRVLEVVLTAGARQAFPGEFTFRAYMNRKMDLSQAEAVQTLIGAKNERAMEAAKGQLQGNLSEKITGFQNRLTAVAAILEAWVDFPEEGLEFASFEEVSTDLEQCFQEMERLLATFHNGKVLQNGIALCLIGSPNVGKSSLMNALLDKNRAIVSHLPGTTRDVVEDHLLLNGLHFRLIDTAGIRETEELIEREGIARSKEALHQADLVLLVLDAYQGVQPHDQILLDLVPKGKTIAVWNKIDLSPQSPLSLNLPAVCVSAKYRKGLEELQGKIEELIWQEGPPSKEEVLLTNVRHKEALGAALQAGRRVLEGLVSKVSPEFLSLDMRQCLSELGKIKGVDVTEDILSSIFSKFCVGK